MAAARPDDRERPLRGMLSRGVHIYREGLVHISVCAPNDLTAGDVLAIVNAESPAGLLGQIGWSLSEGETFSGGEPNPTPCNLDPDRTHRLFVC